MARNTITDVRERVELLNRQTDDVEFSFQCWGTGQNKYQLVDDDGKAYGPVCTGASEFLKVVRAFDDGRRL